MPVRSLEDEEPPAHLDDLIRAADLVRPDQTQLLEAKHTETDTQGYYSNSKRPPPTGVNSVRRPELSRLTTSNDRGFPGSISRVKT